MNLLQVIKLIEKAAMLQPSINMIVRHDVFRINNAPSLKYGVFAWTQGQHSGSINGMQTYNFTLFYVDRLREDLNNQTEIHSVGCETIFNIVKMLEDKNVFIDSWNIQPFNQRFTDSCAGVYANVSVQTTATHLCFETFADFNDDFNDDFLFF